jgi:Tol biopolymer transport system component
MSDRLDLDFERQIGDWLRVQAPPRAPGSLLTTALDQVAVIPQERPIAQRLLGERLGRSRALRYALVVALLVAAILAGLVLIGGPRPLPVLGRLTYSLNGDIYLADWDGANAARIANGSSAAGYRFPKWSPDGRYLMYELWREAGDQTVFVTDSTGAVVTSFSGGWASWSPDSTKIATCCHDVHSITGELLIHLAEPPGWDGANQFAGWLAEGNAVILSLELPGIGHRTFAVWALPVDGGAPYRIANGLGGLGNHVLSPDGTRLAVFQDGQTLNILDSSGARLATITELNLPFDSFPWDGGDFWSPDGRRIAYGQGNRLNVFDVSSGTVTTLVTTDDSAAPLRWSPDGGALLFVSPNEVSSSGPSPASIWRVGKDGSDPFLVVRGTSDGDWQWLRTNPGGG